MNILAFDTCFDACSVAVCVAGHGRSAGTFHAAKPMRTGHAEALLPMMADVFSMAGANTGAAPGEGLSFADIDLIAVTHGPGTFTGTRIGIAAARGFLLAGKAQIVSASSLLLIGLAVMEHLRDFGTQDVLLVTRQARAGQLYMQLLGHGGHELTPPLLATPEAAAAHALGVDLPPKSRVFVTGSGTADVLAAGCSPRHASAPLLDAAVCAAVYGTAELPSEPDALTLLAIVPRLVASRLAPSPLYLRPPDAKPQAGKALAGAAPRSEPGSEPRSGLGSGPRSAPRSAD